MARCLSHLVLGALGVVLTLAMTVGDSRNQAIVLRNRLAVGLPLLLLGIIALAFKAPTLRVCVCLGKLTRLADDTSKSRGARQLADCGRWALWTGLAIALAAILYFAVVSNTPTSFPPL